jgi:hypothetical protein
MKLLSEMLEDAHLQSVYNRLAKVLVKLALSHGQNNGSSAVVVNDVSQETLGLMVGATRQSIARELKKMESEELVYWYYCKLTIPDLPKMISHFDYILPADYVVARYSEL